MSGPCRDDFFAKPLGVLWRGRLLIVVVMPMVMMVPILGQAVGNLPNHEGSVVSLLASIT
jgi:hypothetical protein